MGEGCYLLRLANVTVLLDCPLDLRALSVFVPQFRSQPFAVTRPDGKQQQQQQQQHGAGTDDVLVQLHGQERILGAFQLCPPRLDVLDASIIDVVLIANAQGMLGLPYLVARPGFRARVFATEPTRELGRSVFFVSLR